MERARRDLRVVGHRSAPADRLRGKGKGELPRGGVVRRGGAAQPVMTHAHAAEGRDYDGAEGPLRSVSDDECPPGHGSAARWTVWRPCDPPSRHDYCIRVVGSAGISPDRARNSASQSAKLTSPEVCSSIILAVAASGNRTPLRYRLMAACDLPTLLASALSAFPSRDRYADNAV